MYLLCFSFLFSLRTFYAVDPVTREEFAIKIQLKTPEAQKEFTLAERIFHECQDKTNILNIIEYKEEDDLIYFKMEYCDKGV